MNSCTVDRSCTRAPKDATKLALFFRFLCLSFVISMKKSVQRWSSGLQGLFHVKNQENCAGKLWSLHAPLKNGVAIRQGWPSFDIDLKVLFWCGGGGGVASSEPQSYMHSVLTLATVTELLTSFVVRPIVRRHRRHNPLSFSLSLFYLIVSAVIKRIMNVENKKTLLWFFPSPDYWKTTRWFAENKCVDGYTKCPITHWWSPHAAIGTTTFQFSWVTFHAVKNANNVNLLSLSTVIRCHGMHILRGRSRRPYLQGAAKPKACAHYVMLSGDQRKSLWLAISLSP